MKRSLITLVLLAFPVLASAGTPDRDVLLTPGGTLYSVESVFPSEAAAVHVTSDKLLLLTLQQGDVITTVPVPGSLATGIHTNPALAYDSSSDSLFIFWEQSINNRQSTSLLFCSYQTGKWSNTTEIDAANWRLRHNLKIGMTRKTEAHNSDGNPVLFDQLNVHAVWWEESGYGEWARSAMFTIDNKGRVSGTYVNDMAEFVNGPGLISYDPSDVNPEVFRHPALIESATHDTIDVVFGDTTNHAIHRVTLKPVADTRVRIPIGVRSGGGPRMPVIANEGRMGVFASEPDHDRLVFYFPEATRISYVLLKNGSWSSARAIATNDKVSADAAINAIRKMISSE